MALESRPKIKLVFKKSFTHFHTLKSLGGGANSFSFSFIQRLRSQVVAKQRLWLHLIEQSAIETEFCKRTEVQVLHSCLSFTLYTHTHSLLNILPVASLERSTMKQPSGGSELLMAVITGLAPSNLRRLQPLKATTPPPPLCFFPAHLPSRLYRRGRAICTAGVTPTSPSPSSLLLLLFRPPQL